MTGGSAKVESTGKPPPLDAYGTGAVRIAVTATVPPGTPVALVAEAGPGAVATMMGRAGATSGAGSCGLPPAGPGPNTRGMTFPDLESRRSALLGGLALVGALAQFLLCHLIMEAVWSPP